MVEYIKDNPVALSRFRAQQEQRAQNQDARLEEQGFQNRYAHETSVNVDRAVRSALGGYQAQGQAPAPGTTQEAAGPQPGAGVIDISQARTPGFNPGPSGGQNQNLIRSLSGVEGGGALALKYHTQDQARRNQRQDGLEDKAWSMLANAKRPADLEMANAMFKQATGKDLPPQWRTQEAALKAATIDAAARERYPRDVVQRRAFIEMASTKGLNMALTQMAGESGIGKNGVRGLKTITDANNQVHVVMSDGSSVSTGLVAGNASKWNPQKEVLRIYSDILKDPLNTMTQEEAWTAASEAVTFAQQQFGGYATPPAPAPAPSVEQAASGPEAAKPLPASKEHLAPNTWYATKKGPLFWDGRQWMGTSNPAAAATDDGVNSALRNSHQAD